MREQILKASDSAKDLEALYRSAPKQFSEAFPTVYREAEASPLLDAWHERLAYDLADTQRIQTKTPSWNAKDIYFTLLLIFIAGTFAKLPQFIPELNSEFFYARNFPTTVIAAVMAFFLIQRGCSLKTIGLLTSSVVLGLLYLNLIPPPENSDTSLLACLHLPFAFWSLTGIAFLGGKWNDQSGRMNYIRYNGELIIFTTVIVIGGMVLTGITFALFNLIGLRIEEAYLNSVGHYGGVGAPLVATLLITRIIGERLRIAPLLAKLFTPLFLLMTSAYLVTMLVKQQSPFTNREFLIAFNGLLLIVLGLCVFSISERGKQKARGPLDYMNISLVSVTLAVDLIALAAILFRLTSYGFTPNRVAVLGANILAFCHLAGILVRYIQFLRKTNSFESLELWIVRFLPAYTCWALIVAIVLPVLSRFK